MLGGVSQKQIQYNRILLRSQYQKDRIAWSLFSEWGSCTDPENFVEGPNSGNIFVVDEGREDPYTDKRRHHGPVSEAHLKCFSLEGC